MGEHEPRGLELEIAVLRGQEWVYRGVFRAPAMISVGSSPSTVLALPGANLPEYHELIRIYSDGGLLFFQPGMAVELRLEEGVKRNDELLDEGLAVAGNAGWKVPLGLGSKGAFRIAEVAVLFKVRAPSPGAIQAVPVGDPPRCGNCGTGLPWAIVGFGGLTPCTSCKTLNEVQPEGQDPALGETELAPAVKSRPMELPTFDAISAKALFEGSATQEVERSHLSDLPTFDAISVSAPVVPEGPRKAEGAELSMPTRRMPESEALAGAASAPARPAVIPKGADLPTFDAISLPGSEAAGSPSEDLPATQIGPAPYLSETSSWSPGSEVEVTIEEEDEFFDGEAPVSMDLQRSYNAIPVLKKEPATVERIDATSGDEPLPTDEFASTRTRQVLVPKDMIGQAVTVPEMKGSSFVGGVPSEGRREAVSAPYEPGPTLMEPVSSTELSPTAPPRPPPAVAPPPGSGAPAGPRAVSTDVSSVPAPAPARQVPVPATKVSSPTRDGDEGGDDDDFLMGRVSIPGTDTVKETNLWLILIGAVSGILGLALILYGLFG
ncbi:MAG: hypothetical protein KDA24_21320 [Deltaproteobacteria bacterium]|nr:hypothetical protein [Deltaproteobacteria bacterium]